MESSFLRVAIAVSLLATGARAAPDAGVSGAPDGAATCGTSGDCAMPTPYCHATRHVCVQCLGDTNCASRGGVCDVTEGICVACADDSDCWSETPYCDRTSHECVTCLTDANCGYPGVKCVDGECGSCGDGVCGPHETIRDAPQSSPFPFDTGRVLCPEECAAECPGVDLGSVVGVAVHSLNGRGLYDRLGDDTCGGVGSPDESLTWKAPATGRYVWRTRAPGFDDYALYLTAFEGDCQSAITACNGNTLAFDVTKDQVLVVAIDGLGDQPTFVLDITTDDPTAPDAGPSACSPVRCPAPEKGGVPCCMTDGTNACGTQTEFGCRTGSLPPPPPIKDGGPVDPVLRRQCIQNAILGPGPVCASAAECVCSACPQSVEDCRVIPHCVDLLRCMEQQGCTGVECNTPGACGSIIATAEGPSGAAFRAASDVQTCASVKSCDITCASPSSRDGGSACEGGTEASCECDDGRPGVHVCKDDGSDYGHCVCVQPEAGADGGAPSSRVTSSGGCDCSVSKTRSNVGAWPLVPFALALGRSRRRRKRAPDDQNKQVIGAPPGAG